MKVFKINDDFVIRNDGEMIFDSNKFIIHNFNVSGLEIIKLLLKKPTDLAGLCDELPSFPKNDIYEFLEEVKKLNIVVEK
ncbi:hypothetical protein [Vibrio salinus]|uniref:hypothetical protein n=1 Tax=Vibrio salinus TaxID=2899784 RepID=UPI001E3803D1|nr:hypothetical protein [Vibrio salinus]MCE0493778.1 hypothetical protein [Vibrio salinus]